QVEYGEGVASRLKLSEDGRFILWPQPTRYPDDPQNWTAGQKNLQLLIVTLAAFVPDFNSSLGIASLFGLAEQYHKSVDHVSSSCNRSIFQLGTSGLIVILLVKRFGRLPILFWSQLIGLGFTIGCTVAPNFSTFAACRILQATFQNAPQVTGLYTICDMYPFHQQARKINMWNFGFIVSPFIGPSVLGFMAPRTGWRWIYGVGCIFDGLVLIIITLFAKETMFDRHVHPIPRPTSTGLRRRVEDLLGVTGRNMAQYRPSWKRVIYDLFNVAWRPQSVLPGIYIFGGIGVNVTQVIFILSPPPLGYGLNADQLAGTYFSPVIAVVIGEALGHFLNDFIANYQIKRNHGVFEAEMRLWTLYIALPFFIAGFIIIGECFEHKLNVGGLVIGWIASRAHRTSLGESAVLVSTVCIYAYLNNAFPDYNGEVSALINFWRVMGGFAIPYYQTDWVARNGASVVVYGSEAAITAGLFLLIVPLLQIKGRAIRHRFSIRKGPATVQRPGEPKAGMKQDAGSSAADHVDEK
ncbi:MFS general substrate transporter, partial [Atractiella rhizophila]